MEAAGFAEAVEQLREEVGEAELVVDDVRVVYVNHVLCRITGYSRAELIGMSIYDLFPPEYRATLSFVLQTGIVPKWEQSQWKLRCKSGLLVEIEGNRKVVCTAAGSRMVIIGRNITGRQETPLEAQIRDGIQATFQHAPVGIAHADPGARLVTANDRFCEIVGYRHEEVLGTLVSELIWPADRQAAHAVKQDPSYSPDKPIRGEWRFRHKDGHAVWVSMMVARMPLESREASSNLYIIVIEDITQRRLVQEERARLLEREQAARARAEEVSRLKDDFLAIVSHELRTPLTSVIGWSQLLRRGGLAEEERARGLESIERNAVAQHRIGEDLLDASQIIKGNVRLQIGPVHLGEVVRSAIDGMRPAASAKAIQVETRIDGGIPAIYADADRLHQVTYNLLSNAVKFTPRGGRVAVRCFRSDSEWVLSVSDTGRGISADFLPYVFDRFRQEEAACTRTAGGLGLGLSIVKNLVELHSGTVTAESAGEGQGATFTVKVPARTATTSPLTAREVPPSARALEGVSVLLVDDDADARELLATVLVGAGARVTVAASVPEALAAIDRAAPALLVSDIGMPGQDGYHLIQLLRARRRERIPAVAVTAFASADDCAHALAAGYDAHVPRPVDVDRFQSVLERVLAATRR